MDKLGQYRIDHSGRSIGSGHVALRNKAGGTADRARRSAFGPGPRPHRARAYSLRNGAGRRTGLPDLVSGSASG